MMEFDRSALFVARMRELCSKIVRKTAFDVQARAVADAPYDTGNLRNSIYVKTQMGNLYPGSASGHLIEDQVPEADEMTAWVAVAADYGIYVEMGTVHMPAHPYLLPAAEAMRAEFEAAFAKLDEINIG